MHTYSRTLDVIRCPNACICAFWFVFLHLFGGWVLVVRMQFYIYAASLWLILYHCHVKYVRVKALLERNVYISTCS